MYEATRSKAAQTKSHPIRYLPALEIETDNTLLLTCGLSHQSRQPAERLGN